MNAERHLRQLAQRGRDILARNDDRAGGNRPFGGDWYRIKNADDEPDTTKIYVYDHIGGWFGITASDFLADLDKVETSTINLHINSGGGDVFDAVAIYSGLRNHKATVNVAVDGLAASAASFIAMAGDTIGIEKPARMMIHDASGLVIGNAADMRDMADLLDDVSDTIAEIYADRAGESTATWRGRMKSETWYSAQQAVAAKLADSIIGNTPAEATNRDRISQQIRARARARMRGSAA